MEQETKESSTEETRQTGKELLFGAVLGTLAGGIMFLIPDRLLHEEIRLVLALVIIVMGPWAVREKGKLEFSRGRFSMAGGILLTLLIRYFTQA